MRSCGKQNDHGTWPKSSSPFPFLKLLMKDGNIWYLRFFVETLKPVKRAELAKIIYELTGFHAVKPEGGAVLFNMKNVISWTTYPTALLASQKTWELKNNNN